MRLTPHFELEEFTQSSTALRLGIDNTPGPEIVKRLKVVAEKLEVIRQAAFLQSNAIIISSGYRSPHLNRVVGGSKNSAHIWGWAADIKVRGFTALELARIIQDSGIEFDQLIQEGTWVHVSFDPKMRGQILTAKFVGGIAHYTEGLHATV